jgi:hypothetical protein
MSRSCSVQNLSRRHVYWQTNALMLMVLECHPISFISRTSVAGRQLIVLKSSVAICCLLLLHKLEDDTMFSGRGARRSQRTVLLLTVQSTLMLTLLSTLPQLGSVRVRHPWLGSETSCCHLRAPYVKEKNRNLFT